MMLDRLAILAAALMFALGGMGSLAPALAEAPARRLLVLDFEIVDTSGEPTDQRADHARRLALMRDAITTTLTERKVYDIVDRAKIATELAAVLEHQYLRTCNGCELTLGEHADADLVMTGEIDKVSTLIMSMKVWIKSVRSGQLLFFKTFDFRGDTDQSWSRAAKFFAGRIATDPPK